MGPWLTTIGLLLDIVGVVILACGVIVTNERAKTLAATKWNGNTELEKQLLQGAREQDFEAVVKLASVTELLIGEGQQTPVSIAFFTYSCA